MIDDLTRSVLEQRDNIENQRNRELNSNREHYIKQLENKIQQLKDIRETAINYIDQVIMYKPCAREIDKELDILIGILRGGNNE